MKLLYVTDALAIYGGLERILVEKVNLLRKFCIQRWRILLLILLLEKAQAQTACVLNLSHSH